jgi:hypothetical protein
MRNLFILIALILYLFTACTDRSKDDFIQMNHGKKFLVSMNIFDTDAEQYISFPLLFNNSIVRQQKIKKITRDFFTYEPSENTDDSDGITAVPREKREYWFNENGQLSDLKISYFYDDEMVGSQKFHYSTGVDSYGFAEVTFSDEKNNSVETEDENMDFPIKIHRKVKQTSKYLAYQDEQNGNYLFFMLDNKYWGPLSIDSIIHPRKKDIIFLGKPTFPTKRYSVRNKVNESNITKFEYNSKSKGLQTISKQEYPFDKIRTLLYEKNGLCTRYIDSTFSEKTFLTRVVTNIIFDTKNRPIKIIHKKENQLNEVGRVSIEKIKYE